MSEFDNPPPDPSDQAPPPRVIVVNHSDLPDRPPADPWAVAQAQAIEAQEKYRRSRRRQLRISVLLFLATFASTTLVGSMYLPIRLLPVLFHPEISWADAIAAYAQAFWIGFEYSGPVMLILFCHEMGHFLQAVRYRVPASFPFFIPLPLPPLGTMGAVIAQGRGVADRRQMFDIAVSGPLAGLVVTLPVLYWGLQSSRIVALPEQYTELGEPLLIQWMITWLHGPVSDGQILEMNGVAMAGWVGVFITALNLLPVGQLDGGHLTYTLMGRPAHWLAIALVVVAAAAMIVSETYSYVLFLVLILFMGPRHPPTRDDTVPLGLTRHIIGWLTLAFLVIGFTPTPMAVVGR